MYYQVNMGLIFRLLFRLFQKTMFVINDQGNCTKQNITTPFQANCVPGIKMSCWHFMRNDVCT